METDNIINSLASISLSLENAKAAEYASSSLKIEEENAKSNLLFFLRTGECLFRINEDSLAATKGSLFFVPQGSSYSVIGMGIQSCSLFICGFFARVKDYYLFDVLKTESMAKVTDSDKIKAIASCLCQPAVGTKFENTILQLNKHKALCELLTCYITLSNPVWSDNFEKRSSGMSSIVIYIKEHLAENLTNELLAEKVSLHPNYFIKSFQNMYGITPMKYVGRARLEKAKQLLCDTDFTLSEIAERTGLGNPSNFIKKYKANYGITPGNERDKG